MRDDQAVKPEPWWSGSLYLSSAGSGGSVGELPETGAGLLTQSLMSSRWQFTAEYLQRNRKRTRLPIYAGHRSSVVSWLERAASH